VAAAAPEGGVETSSELPGLIEDLVRKSTLNHSKVGLEVISLDDGRVVYASHAQDLLNPASNTKIFTSAAALARLGSDYRWVTEVYVDSLPVGGVLRGPLTIRGKGDPSLTSERLWEVALELWHQGLREVKGDLILDDSYFDQVFEGPGWDQDRTDRAYMAPISALATNFGAFGIYVTPADHAGAKANVEIEPMSPYFKLDNRVTTVAHRKRLRHLATTGAPGSDGWHVVVTGTVPVDQPTSTLWRRVGDPTIYTGETFKQILAQRGIKVTGRVKRGLKGPNARLYYSSESEELDLVVRHLNKHSSNFIAEMLLKTLGAEVSGPPGSWPNGVSAIEDFLAKDIGIPRGTYVMKNGSGLNDVNRFSADQVVRVLAYLYPRVTLAPEYLASLGIAGKDGTLRFRMQDTPAAGRVRAKTGTLENVSALSGYAESLSGHHFAFSILINDFPTSVRQVTAAEDALAITLASEAAATPAPPIGVPGGEALARAKVYVKLATQHDPANAPFLRSALRGERDPAVRALIADALFQSEPAEWEATEALLQNLPLSAGELDRLRSLTQQLGLGSPLLPSLVDLASDGDARGINGLIETAVIDGAAESPDRDVLSQSFAEVAFQAPKELLEALAQAQPEKSNAVLPLLAQGLAKNPEAGVSFAAKLWEATNSARWSGFASKATELLKLPSPDAGATPVEAAPTDAGAAVDAGP
jgi:D-alanyl-D-alanine carboxypeptidase/D-alanyl-D-alanine-endopeptidase (penicillin-binding protein 4)